MWRESGSLLCILQNRFPKKRAATRTGSPLNYLNVLDAPSVNMIIARRFRLLLKKFIL